MPLNVTPQAMRRIGPLADQLPSRGTRQHNPDDRAPSESRETMIGSLSAPTENRKSRSFHTQYCNSVKRRDLFPKRRSGEISARIADAGDIAVQVDF